MKTQRNPLQKQEKKAKGVSSFFAFGLLGCFISASLALAEEPRHDEERDRREDVRFECHFRGFQLRKVPIFCEAHGRLDRKIPRNHYITGDRDDYLTVTCGDRLVYDAGVVYGLFTERDHDDRDHDGPHDGGPEGDLNHDHDHDYDRDRRRDDFFDVKILSITPFTAAINVENACTEGFDGGSDRATLTVALLDRVPVSLFGSCHFRRERDERRDDHVPAPSVSPAPTTLSESTSALIGS